MKKNKEEKSKSEKARENKRIKLIKFEHGYYIRLAEKLSKSAAH